MENTPSPVLNDPIVEHKRRKRSRAKKVKVVPTKPPFFVEKKAVEISFL